MQADPVHKQKVSQLYSLLDYLTHTIADVAQGAY